MKTKAKTKTKTVTRAIVRVVGSKPLAPWAATHVVFDFTRAGQSVDGYTAVTKKDLRDVPVAGYRGWFVLGKSMSLSKLIAKVQAEYPGIWERIDVHEAEVQA